MTAAASSVTSASAQTLAKETNEKTQSAESIHKQLHEVAIRVLTEMSTDTLSREKNFKAGKHSQFNEGVHSIENYFHSMKGLGQKGEPQLKGMRKKGHFYFGKAPEEFGYGKDASSPYGFSPMQYILQKGKPSAALVSLRKGFTFLNCGEACQLAYYTALCEVLKDKFDSLFHEKAPTPLAIGVSNELSAMNLLLNIVALNGKPNEIKKGQWTSVNVIEEYAEKHICGDREGYNVLCVEEGANPKFVGFRLDPKGVTQVQVTEALVAEYNKTPILDSDIASEAVLKQITGSPNYEENLKKAMSLKEKQITLAEYQNAGGGVFQEVMDFNMERIMQLVNAVPNDGKLLLTKWREEVVKAYENADADAPVPDTAPVDNSERDFRPAPLKAFNHTTNF